MDRDLVSVVLAARNAASTVGTAIRSVLAQTHSDLELLIVEDASTDDTSTVLAPFESDGRLRIQRNTTRRGAGPSRDSAIAGARGRWIAVIDADDAWKPNRLETLLAATGGDERVLAFDDLLICHEDLSPWKPLHGPAGFGPAGESWVRVPFATFIRSEMILVKPLTSSSLVRVSGAHHGTEPFGEDTRFFLMLAARCVEMRYVSRPLYLYRRTPGSASARRDRTALLAQVIGSCAGLEGFSASDRAAIAAKLEQLGLRGRYERFYRSIRAGRLDVLLQAAREPRLLVELARRSRVQSIFLFHAWLLRVRPARGRSGTGRFHP